MSTQAHHVTAQWGKAILGRLQENNRVLGLTGTPPLGSRGWDQFVSLVGSTPVQIATPPLVRERHLCPYQDLVWPVIVDMEDVPGLLDIDAKVSKVEATVRARMGVWIAKQLQEDLCKFAKIRFWRKSLKI